MIETIPCRRGRFDKHCDPRCIQRLQDNISLRLGALVANPSGTRTDIQAVLPKPATEEFTAFRGPSNIIWSIKAKIHDELEVEYFDLLDFTKFRLVPYARAALLNAVGITNDNGMFRPALELCLPNRRENDTLTDAVTVSEILTAESLPTTEQSVNFTESHIAKIALLKLALVCDDTSSESRRFNPCRV